MYKLPISLAPMKTPKIKWFHLLQRYIQNHNMIYIYIYEQPLARNVPSLTSKTMRNTIH